MMPECGTRGMGSHAEVTGLPQTKLVGSTSTLKIQSLNNAQNDEPRLIIQAPHIAPANNGGAICGL